MYTSPFRYCALGAVVTMMSSFRAITEPKRSCGDETLCHTI